MNKYYLRRATPALYTGEHWHSTTDPDGAPRNLMSERAQKLVDMREEIDWIIERHAYQGLHPRVLDVGCGPGWSRHPFENAGLEWYGVEPDRSFGYDDRIRTSLVDYDLMKDQFDAMLCYHVIEHMSEPVDELFRMWRMLRPGGSLVISTPDFGSPVARAWGNRFRLLHDSTHVNLFTSWNMVLLLNEIGFDVQDVRWPYFGTRHHTRENLLRLEDPSTDVSPPAPGNIVSVYVVRR